MSKPELDNIIQSQEAETFLQMVTKEFYRNSFIGLWIYEVIGREWDEMREWTEGLKDEIHPQTCTWSIAIWEWIYGIETDESLSLEYRRRRILSKAVGVRPINPEIIRRGISALIGGTDSEVAVNDFVQPYKFDIAIHTSLKRLLNYAEIFDYIYRIKPSHLAYGFACRFRDFEDRSETLFFAKHMAIVVKLAIPEQSDEYSFQSSIRVGGRTSQTVRLPVSEQQDTLSFQSEIETGGRISRSLVTLPVVEQTDDMRIHSRLGTGGRMAFQAKLPSVQYYPVESP